MPQTACEGRIKVLDPRKKSFLSGRVGVVLLVVALSLCGCALWNRGSPGKEGEQAGGKDKAPASSKGQVVSAPPPAAGKADKPDAKEPDKQTEKPLTES